MTKTAERLAVIEATLARIEERLFGNGQPGELALLQARVRRLEIWSWRAIGGLSVLALLAEAVSHR